MTHLAERLLATVYGVSSARLRVIPHGVPEVPFERDESQRARLGLTGRQVLCTFGLINRGKGLEYMIKAMPRIVASCSEAIYSIVGPPTRRSNSMREKFPRKLGRDGPSAGRRRARPVCEPCSAFPTCSNICRLATSTSPLTPERSRSPAGPWRTLSPRAEPVSTPYLYAEEVLAEGRGQLVSFADSNGLAEATLRFLSDNTFLQETRRKAYAYATPMFWPTSAASTSIFSRVLSGPAARDETTDLRSPWRHRFTGDSSAFSTRKAGVVRSPIHSSRIDDFIIVYQ